MKIYTTYDLQRNMKGILDEAERGSVYIRRRDKRFVINVSRETQEMMDGEVTGSLC